MTTQPDEKRSQGPRALDIHARAVLPSPRWSNTPALPHCTADDSGPHGRTAGPLTCFDGHSWRSSNSGRLTADAPHLNVDELVDIAPPRTGSWRSGLIGMDRGALQRSCRPTADGRSRMWISDRR